jgi:hypothetical protein
MLIRAAVAIALGIFIAADSAAQAGVNPRAVCKEKKAKAAGKKTADLLKAFGKNTKKPNGAKLDSDISKARSKFTKGFTKAEATGTCPTSGDSGTIAAKVDAFVDHVVSGGAQCLCGDNIRCGAEQCDGTDDTACPGECTPECVCAAISTTTTTSTSTTTTTTLHLVDNGDGTITDNQTGLMWEKKDDAGGIHDWASFSWWSTEAWPWTGRSACPCSCPEPRAPQPASPFSREALPCISGASSCS